METFFMQVSELYPIYCQSPSVTTDSRAIKTGDLFFALKGDRFDGNQYAMQAIEKGAAFAIVDDPGLETHPQLIRVEDVLTTLQNLATYHRRQFNIPIIAITGSNGKTTTKELLHAVLSSAYPTHCTKGNFNNHIGVPLTLLAMPLTTEVAIIEMGANHVGEIGFLCQLAEPTHGLITNVGNAHLEGFGGFEGVKKGKSELYRFLEQTDGMVFISEEEPLLFPLVEGVQKLLSYRAVKDLFQQERSYYSIQLLGESPFIKAGFLSEEGDLIAVNSHLIGYYNFKNIMTAIALGNYFKVPANKLKIAIEGYVPNNNRSEWVYKDSNTFLLDAYNANPSSMKAALNFFGSYKAPTKAVILGDMLELGAISKEAHIEILNFAKANSIETIICVGNLFYEVAEEENVFRFKDVNALKTWFAKQEFRDTHFLIKGSRGIKLEQLIRD